MGNPRLYGIERSNRSSLDHWGKNTFNSSFPTALACWMRDKEIPAAGLILDTRLQVAHRDIDFNDVFATTLGNKDIIFDFESKYEPYQQYSYDDIRGIDLVLRDDTQYYRALEIKLTVIPDNTTAEYKDPSRWGSELVLRPASTSYAVLGMAHSLKDYREDIRAIFEPACSNVRDWTNTTEMIGHLPSIIRCIDKFHETFREMQIPFLMQPIWRTQGKEPILTENAFDIFVWTDFALTRMIADRATDRTAGISRPARETLRMARALYDLSTRGIINTELIYTRMSFGTQTDKACAFSGRITNRYMSGDRLGKPIVNKNVLSEIILGGGEKLLSPERRFDQTIYYAKELSDA